MWATRERFIEEIDEIECVSRLVWHSRWKITKQIVGENRCNDISFRPLTGYPQRKMWKGIKIEFFPKRRYYIGYGKKLNLSSVYIREGLENLSSTV